MLVWISKLFPMFKGGDSMYSVGASSVHSSNSDGLIRDMLVISDLNITSVSEIQDTPEKQCQCRPPKTIPNTMDGGRPTLLPPLPASYSFNSVETLGLSMDDTNRGLHSSLMGFHNDGCDLILSSIAHLFEHCI